MMKSIIGFVVLVLSTQTHAAISSCNIVAYENYTDELLALPGWNPQARQLIRAQDLGVLPPVYFNVGDVVRVRVDFGTGTIQNGTQAFIQRARFTQNCLTSGINCTPFEPVTAYVGDASITTTCIDELSNPIKWTTNIPNGSSVPNTLIFTASSQLTIPAMHFESVCVLAYDVKAIALPSGSTSTNPINITQNFGFQANMWDAYCNNKPQNVSSGWADNLILQLCPRCNIGTRCDQQTGLCGPDTLPTPTPAPAMISIAPGGLTPVPGEAACGTYGEGNCIITRCADGQVRTVCP